MPSQKDRYYSAPPATHNVSMMYGYSPTAYWTGNNGVTGNWVAANFDPSGRLNVNIAGASFTGELSLDEAISVTGQYTFASPVLITGSQTQIPAGAKSWSVSIISGFAFINGTGPIYSYANLNGGGYTANSSLTTAINIGCTGTASDPSQVLVMWET